MTGKPQEEKELKPQPGGISVKNWNWRTSRHKTRGRCNVVVATSSLLLHIPCADANLVRRRAGQ